MKPTEGLINVAVIGPGRMGMRYADILRRERDVRVVAVCGHSEETTKRNATRLGVPLFFNNQFDLMFETHPEIHAVVIATAEWAHLEPILASATRGKHMLIEKPLGTSIDSVDRMASAVRAGAGRAVLCLTSRFDPRCAVAQQTLGRHDYGKVGYLYLRRNADRLAAARVTGRFPLAHWLACHDVDLARWFTKSEVCEVTAFTSGRPGAGDFLHVELALANGSRALIETSWFGERLEGSHHSQIDIECERGRIELDMSAAPLKNFHGATGRPELPDVFDCTEVHGAFVGATPSLLRHFVQVARGSVESAATIDDGVAAARVCDAIQISVDERRSIVVGAN